jgi:hypothetical protein
MEFVLVGFSKLELAARHARTPGRVSTSVNGMSKRHHLLAGTSTICVQ